MSETKKTSIGGQALIEGIMMRGPKVTAMAVRDEKGAMQLDAFPTGAPRAGITGKPFIRGIFNMYDTLRVGYKCLMRSAEIAGIDDDAKKKEAEGGKKSFGDKLFSALVMPLATVLAIALALGLFLYLPTQLYKWLQLAVPYLAGRQILQSVFEGVTRIAIFVGYVAAISLMKDIRRTFMYHGGEHKTIYCYEAGLPLTVENVRVQKRLHPRCGTSFIILVLMVGIIVSIFIPTSLPTLARVGIKLGLIPVVVGVGYELLKLAGRSSSRFTRVISAPGLLLQRLTVREPDDSMIECAIAAMEKVIPEDGSDKW